jgi:hypothetical protein
MREQLYRSVDPEKGIGLIGEHDQGQQSTGHLPSISKVQNRVIDMNNYT